MIKKLLLASALFVAALSAKSQIVITEIMYNHASHDTLEFIELYNNSSATVDMTGYEFTSGVVFTFPSFNLAANSYAVVALDSFAFANVGQGAVVDFQWTSGSLSNSGEAITLKTTAGVLVDSLSYSDASPWNIAADG